MLCSGDQIVLQIWGEINKVGAVTSNTHDQASVLLRILLSCQQGFLVQNVELHMPEFQIAEGADEGNQFFGAFVAFNAFGGKLDVQHSGGTVTHTHVLGIVVGKQYCGGAIDIGAMRS